MAQKMKFKLITNGGDYVVVRCNTCQTEFYSSPCGEENVQWDEAEKCLRTVCPNCIAPGVRSE